MSEKRHRFEDALGYAQGFLDPAEKADFEAHLATCADCRESVAYARDFVPALNRAILEPAPLTDAQLLANVRAEHEQRTAAKAERGWLRHNWGKLALGIGAALVVILTVTSVVGNQPGHLYAPLGPKHHYLPDAGDAGRG